MPTQQALDSKEFMGNYDALQRAITYAQQWTDQIATLTTALQAHPDFQTALTPDDQAAIVSASASAITFTQAQPVKVIKPVNQDQISV